MKLKVSLGAKQHSYNTVMYVVMESCPESCGSTVEMTNVMHDAGDIKRKNIYWTRGRESQKLIRNDVFTELKE